MNLSLQRVYAVVTVAVHVVQRSTVTPGFKSSPYWHGGSMWGNKLPATGTARALKM